MFGWFRRNIRKVEAFGVGVEFHPPTEPAPPPLPPTDVGRVVPITPTTAPSSAAGKKRTTKVTWTELIAILQERVGPGQVTTYKMCSLWAFDHDEGGNSVRSMLEAAAKRGHHVLTNRVVFADGSCGAADQAYGQSAQLRAEGVPFIGQAVDLKRCPPVKLSERGEPDANPPAQVS